MSLDPGTRLGPYEIVAQIGAGGMGEVYRARDSRLGRDVAVKVLPTDLATDAERLRRFEQEARAVGALNHPNILSVFDLGDSDGVRFIVTELLEGETLRERMGDAAVPARKATDYAIQIAEGLAAASASGIVHRDLKPENLFVTRDGRVKILDFGLAKQAAPRLDDATRTSAGLGQPTATTPGTVMGTVAYLSPEQVRGEPADHRSDIFALGAILYEMLKGERPFRAETSVETMTAILRTEPEELTRSVADLSPGLERIVRHCLEKSPDERFQSARDLAFHLGELSTLSSGGLQSVQASPKPKNRRALLAAVAAAAVALVVGYLAGTWNEPTGSDVDYRQMTFRRGTITGARFSPDGGTVIYSAVWEGEPSDVFTTSPDNPESRALGLGSTGLMGISSTGEMAVALDHDLVDSFDRAGTLAHLPLATSTAPRELLENVRWADWSPDGAELAVVRHDGRIRVLEYPIGTRLHETGGWISHPRISPDGDTVAFIEHPQVGDDRGFVAVVDRSDNHRRIGADWSTIWGLAWRPDGKEIWITAGPAAMLAVRGLYGMSLNGETRVLAVGPGEMTLHDVSRAGDVLVTVEDRRRNMVGLPPGAEQEGSLTWLDRSIPIALSADGNVLLFHEGGKAGGAQGSVYLRKLDGSPAVRLSDGYARAFSPDERWVLAVIPTTRDFHLIPSGAGTLRPIEFQHWSRESVFVEGMLADNRRVAVIVRDRDRPPTMHAVDLEAGTEERITPEGMRPVFLSRSGELVVTRNDEGWWILPVEGAAPSPIPGIEPGEFPIALTADGTAVYVQRPEGVTALIFRVEADSGARELIHELRPPNLSGTTGVDIVLITSDGRNYVYGYTQQLSELYLVRGVR
jgi:serine/threonine protein kinase